MILVIVLIRSRELRQTEHKARTGNTIYMY